MQECSRKQKNPEAISFAFGKIGNRDCDYHHYPYDIPPKRQSGNVGESKSNHMPPPRSEQSINNRFKVRQLSRAPRTASQPEALYENKGMRKKKPAFSPSTSKSSKSAISVDQAPLALSSEKGVVPRVTCPSPSIKATVKNPSGVRIWTNALLRIIAPSGSQKPAICSGSLK